MNPNACFHTALLKLACLKGCEIIIIIIGLPATLKTIMKSSFMVFRYSVSSFGGTTKIKHKKDLGAHAENEN